MLTGRSICRTLDQPVGSEHRITEKFLPPRKSPTSIDAPGSSNRRLSSILKNLDSPIGREETSDIVFAKPSAMSTVAFLDSSALPSASDLTHIGSAIATTSIETASLNGSDSTPSS